MGWTSTKKLFETENDTRAFASQIAPVLGAGDTVLLSGDIGAGKSFFSRAVIREIFQEDIEIPSPTFTLVQVYEAEAFDIWHCDLYRLTHPDEAIELGLEDAFEDALCLIEWPDRLSELAPENAVTFHMKAEDAGHSLFATSRSVKWQNKLEALFD